MYDFYKNFIFLSKNLFFFSNKVIYSNKIFVSPFKNLTLFKKNSLCKNILFKQSHSVKDEFYFQFSFATKEQV